MKIVLGVLSCAALVSAAGADVVFSDTEFANSNWALETVFTGPTGNTGSATAAQSAATGNPGNARRVTLTTGGSFGDTVSAFSRYGTTQATRFDPTTQGAINAVSWTIDARFVTGTFAGAGQGLVLGLKQGTVIYGADYHVTGSSGSWATSSATGMTAASFSRLDGLTGTPDFSAAGLPIRFGFIASNSNGGGQYSTTVDYDNFSVTVTQVPAPGAALILGIAGAALRRRR